MGPTLLFDKSALQMLSVDEAVMLDQMFRSIVSPIFFVETMANLAKEVAAGRTPEQIVGSLAEKTPVVHSYITAYHSQMILSDLMGDTVSLSRRPPLPGGIPTRVDGKDGVVFEKSPEAEAFER